LGTGSSLPKTTLRAKINGVWARGACKNLFLQPWKLATSNLVYNLGFGSSLPRNNFYDENWQRDRLGEHPKSFGTPYLFLQPLKLATSVWYTTWAWGVAYQETTLGPKLAGVRARGASKKIGTPYLFLQPLKLATSNLVYNLGLGSSLLRNNFYDRNWRGSGLEYPKKFGTPPPYLFLQQLKLATLVYNLGLWKNLPRKTFTTKIGGVPG